MQSRLYNVAENIMRECGEKIDDTEVISTWMEGAMKLLTLPSVAPDLQEAASGFMVALGSCSAHCNAVSILFSLRNQDTVEKLFNFCARLQVLLLVKQEV